MKTIMKTQITLPQAALTAMTLLENRGFEVYLIGGYVRDALIGRKTGDLDMATDATATQMIELFKDYSLSLIGEKLGTVGVKIEDTWIEITTYRSESTSSNYRHPDEVRFIGSLKDDVLRRDFTINALALNRYGDLIDHTAGQIDLNNRLIRAIGHPEDRFEEDALRILRALRFASQLGFTIEKETEKAMFKQAHLIQTLPIERIAAEIDKLIMGKHAIPVLKQYSELIKPYLDYDETLVDHLELMTSKAYRYLCLLENDEASLIEVKLTRLKLPQALIRQILTFHELIHIQASDPLTIKRLMKHYGKHIVAQASGYAMGRELDAIDARVVIKLLDAGAVVSLRELAVNGDDLKALGLSGKAIKHVLEGLLEDVMFEKLPNDKATLMDAARKLS